MSEPSQFVVEIADLPAVPGTERGGEALSGASTAVFIQGAATAAIQTQTGAAAYIQVATASGVRVAEPAGGD